MNRSCSARQSIPSIMSIARILPVRAVGVFPTASPGVSSDVVYWMRPKRSEWTRPAGAAASCLQVEHRKFRSSTTPAQGGDEMAATTATNPISDLMYDWLTVLQSKAEGLNAYEKYIKDAQEENSQECVE